MKLYDLLEARTSACTCTVSRKVKDILFTLQFVRPQIFRPLNMIQHVCMLRSLEFECVGRRQVSCQVRACGVQTLCYHLLVAVLIDTKTNLHTRRPAVSSCTAQALPLSLTSANQINNRFYDVTRKQTFSGGECYCNIWLLDVQCGSCNFD